MSEFKPSVLLVVRMQTCDARDNTARIDAKIHLAVPIVYIISLDAICVHTSPKHNYSMGVSCISKTKFKFEN